MLLYIYILETNYEVSITALLNLMSAQDAHIEGHNIPPLDLEANYDHNKYLSLFWKYDTSKGIAFLNSFIFDY